MLNKAIWKIGQLIMLSYRRLHYSIGAFLIGYKLGAKCRIYGKLRFGSSGVGLKIGDRCTLGADVFFSIADNAKIVFGNNSSINTGGHIVACKSIVIGDDTAIGEYVSIRDQNHNFSHSDTAIDDQGYSMSAITIGSRVWIGRGCFIGPGVTIGDGAVIAANSVVVKDIPSRVLAGGVPSKIIKKLDEELVR